MKSKFTLAFTAARAVGAPGWRATPLVDARIQHIMAKDSAVPAIGARIGWIAAINLTPNLGRLPPTAWPERWSGSIGAIDAMERKQVHLKMSLIPLLAALLLTPGLAGNAAAAGTVPFDLHDGDRVCFYGDSITEQRFYGVDVQAYVRTRFPGLNVHFVNSGVGGDKVTGGWAGDVDLRLKRDVFPFKPDVVTIMLGMNDARYRPFDPNLFAIYRQGYEHLIAALQAGLPDVRIVLIEPSPFDDVTAPPKFPGGYNAVLLRYAAFVRQLATEHHLLCVDCNGPLVAVLRRVYAEDPALAGQVIPGRVHPSSAGELVMAQALLNAWQAPAMVTAVTLDGKAGNVVQAEQTSVTEVRAEKNGLSWTQLDDRLPFPILGLHDDWPQFPPYFYDKPNSLSWLWPAPLPKWDYTNSVTELVLKETGFYQELDQEPLRVTGLGEGSYRLKIGGQVVGQFSGSELAAGLNLAEYHTPMLEQSYRVLDRIWEEVQWRYYVWRGIQLKLSRNDDPTVGLETDKLVTSLQKQLAGFSERERTAANPQPRHYELTRVPQPN